MPRPFPDCLTQRLTIRPWRTPDQTPNAPPARAPCRDHGLPTVAWDLPLGGLWIGLPLALAAIVLGLRARPAGPSKARSTAAVVLAGLCIAQMGVWTAVAAPG